MTQSTDPPSSPDQGGALSTADQRFDWTRQLSPEVRSVITTVLEIGDRAARSINIVPQPVRPSR